MSAPALRARDRAIAWADESTRLLTALLHGSGPVESLTFELFRIQADLEFDTSQHPEHAELNDELADWAHDAEDELKQLAVIAQHVKRRVAAIGKGLVE